MKSLMQTSSVQDMDLKERTERQYPHILTFISNWPLQITMSKVNQYKLSRHINVFPINTQCCNNVLSMLLHQHFDTLFQHWYTASTLIHCFDIATRLTGHCCNTVCQLGCFNSTNFGNKMMIKNTPSKWTRQNHKSLKHLKTFYVE